jgi:hypothetical protein
MKDNDKKHTRQAWLLDGQVRPHGAVTPRPDQESVWDYPRPPVIVDDTRLVQVRLNNVLIAETRAARRVLETASPPTFYLPPESVQFDCLRPDTGSSYCEWKGRATYFSDLNVISMVSGCRRRQVASTAAGLARRSLARSKVILALQVGNTFNRVQERYLVAENGATEI